MFSSMDSSGDEDEEEVLDCEINPEQLDYFTPTVNELFEKEMPVKPFAKVREMQ